MKTNDFQLLRQHGQLLVLAGGTEKASLQVAAQDDGSFLWPNPLNISQEYHPAIVKPVIVFHFSMEDLVSACSQGDLHENSKKLQKLLDGVVAEYNGARGIWEYYTCGAAVMPCCAGEYIRIVNRKEIKF